MQQGIDYATRDSVYTLTCTKGEQRKAGGGPLPPGSPQGGQFTNMGAWLG